MKLPTQFVAMAFAAVLTTIPFAATHAAIVGVSVPVNSSDATSHPLSDNVWTISVPPVPFDVATGIGFLINPTFAAPGSSHNPSDFTLHDHQFLGANVPDPSRAVVTFKFDTPTIVKGLEIIQHHNGISQVEGFAGNDPNNLTSLGSIFGPNGDVTGFNVFTEYSSQLFDFGNTTSSGTYFQLVVRKTPHPNGWATYRILPLDVNGVPIPPAIVPVPAAFWLLGSALGGLGMVRRCTA